MQRPRATSAPAPRLAVSRAPQLRAAAPTASRDLRVRTSSVARPPGGGQGGGLVGKGGRVAGWEGGGGLGEGMGSRGGWWARDEGEG